MTSSTNSKDYNYPQVGKPRRSSPVDSRSNHGFLFQGQGGRPVLPPLSNSHQTSRLPVHVSYSSIPYSQQHLAHTNLGYDLNPQVLYGTGSPLASASRQPLATYSNYEMHDHRYSSQPSFPVYTSRSSTHNMVNSEEQRRLPPLTTTATSSMERRQQCFVPQPNTSLYGNSTFPSSTVSYPPAYVTYTGNTHHNAYPYHFQQPYDHISFMNPQSHGAMYDDGSRLNPQSTSPYTHVFESSHARSPTQRSYSPAPAPPTSPNEPTIKRERTLADAAQLKVFNSTLFSHARRFSVRDSHFYNAPGASFQFITNITEGSRTEICPRLSQVFALCPGCRALLVVIVASGQ